MNYTKLTPENYNYWWYEVADKNKINEKNFTYEWNDLMPTPKFELLKSLLPYHKINDCIYKIINNALQIICCGSEVDISTGKKMKDIVFNMLYGKKIQLTLF